MRTPLGGGGTHLGDENARLGTASEAGGGGGARLTPSTMVAVVVACSVMAVGDRREFAEHGLLVDTIVGGGEEGVVGLLHLEMLKLVVDLQPARFHRHKLAPQLVYCLLPIDVRLLLMAAKEATNWVTDVAGAGGALISLTRARGSWV